MLVDSTTFQEIPRHFLPSRQHYHYVRVKLATDPLYSAVAAALADTTAPLLDLGCGIGLLAHCCRARGLLLDYRGVDNDVAKIRLACQAAEHGRLSNARFETMDLSQQFPEHQGSVAILDLLQYLPADRAGGFLASAAGCVTETARLIIRTGLQDGSWRAHVTRAADLLAWAIRWTNSAPRKYPNREFLRTHLTALGLEPVFTPLSGNTPFNNWLIVSRRVR